jgi:hypothetical protein
MDIITLSFANFLGQKKFGVYSTCGAGCGKGYVFLLLELGLLHLPLDFGCRKV